MFNKKDNESKQRFGIRKLSVGVCSVLLSTLFLGMGIEVNTPKANAATINASTDSNATDITENSKNQNTSATANGVKSESVKDDTSSNSEKVAANNDQQDSQSAVTQDTQNGEKTADVENTIKTKSSYVTADKTATVEGKSSNKAESSETTDNTKNTVNSDKAEATNKENNTQTDSEKVTQNTSDQVVNNANKNVAEATADTKNAKDSKGTTNLDLENIQELLEQQAKKNDGKALDTKALTSLLRTSGAANFQVLAASATNIAEADEIKANAAITIPSTDGRYTLYISRDTWGNTTNGDQPVKVLLSGNVQAGDTVTISIPSYSIIGVNSPTIDANYGSAFIKDVGNDKVVTYNFTTSGVINPIITIPAGNGYGAKPQPMQITQPTVKDITWTVNGVQQTSAEFHIDVDPVWGPKFSLTKPNPDSTEQNALKKMIPNYESIYQLAINETVGVTPGQDYTNLPYASAKINGAVNYGTVITIPMPKGYVLDQSATMQLNNFGDKTTITQEGNNVIITVPKGSGTQNWNSGPAYQLVGSYDIAMPSAATTYTADAPITIVQKLNDDGSQTKTWTGPTVSQDFYGANDEIPLGQMPLYGKAAYNGNQLLNNGHKQIVAYFGATNESIGSYSDYSSNFTFNFDEGLGVTELKTPTIPGTSNYKYTITYADGTTSKGQVSAGETITGTGVITNIIVSPDDFERDQSTATNLPGNSFANQTTQSVNAFEAYGAVPDTVKPGTQLVANMTFTGAIQQGNVTRYLTSKTQFGQNVVSSDDLTSSSGIFGYQTNTATGQSNVGYLSVYAGGGLTNNIYEPTFYYVLPEWFSVYDFSTDYTKLPDFRPNTNNGVVGAPKLSLFTVPTDTSGLSRQVVKIDYSGTGYNFLAGQGANNLIHLNSLPDGANGSYQGMIYVVSPTTKLTNTAYNPDNTSNFAPNGITFNPDWVQGNTSNLYYVGNSGFTINQVGGANTASVAQGNQNDVLVDSGVSNLYDSGKMEYAVRLINGSGANLTNVVAMVNLPQASNTSFTFQLSGRPVYDGAKSGYTFLYSTELGDLKKNNDPDGTKPDETGYVTADQVTDWSKIKSIIIKVSSLGHAERSDRLVFTGTAPNLVNDAGKTGYLSTGFYSDTTKPFISSLAVYNASTAANKVKPANITITGEAKINFKLQYTDENGQVQTVDLPDLSTSYDLSKSNTMLTAKEAIELANKNAASSIPANYEITSATLQSGGKTWQTNAPEGTPEFGGNVQYFYNGATVVLQAVPIQRTLTYQVIDENDPSNPVTIQVSTDLLNNGQAITGNQGSAVPADATTAYDAVKSALEAKGYVISSNSSTVPETFGPDNTELTIYVTHKTTNVSTSDQWPSTSTNADKVPLSETITRTITVAGLPTAVDGTTQTVTFTRTAVVDEVTGKVIGYVDPSDNSKTITDGADAWTSDDANWSNWTNSNVPEGYYIESAKVGNDNYTAVTTNSNGIITGLNNVTVTPSMSSITVNVVYNKVSLDLTINHDTITNTYNGNEQPVSADVISAIIHIATSSNSNVPVPNIAQAIQSANLTSYDYSYTDDQGKVLTGAPTNAGNYRIILNQNGLDKLNKVAGGLTINYDPSKSYVNYTIDKAEATAKLEGNNSKTYDAKAVTNVEVTKDGKIKVTANVPGTTQGAYELQAGDYDWYSVDGSTKLSAAPTNVGDYTIKLNSTGIANIKAHYGNSDNINWTDDATTGSATYEITQAQATISLTDKNKQTSTWTGSKVPVNPADFVPTITTDNGVTLTVPAGTLAVGDYTVTPSPVAPGTYQVSLTDSGIEKIKKAISTSGNYTWNNTGNGVLEIVNAKADYQMSGSGETAYTGSAIELPLAQLKKVISSSNTVSGQNLVIPELDTNDFTWSSGTAPTNVGDYTIKLSKDGIKKIADANPNYDLTLGKNIFTYKINAATPSASFTGQGEKTYDGTPISEYAPNVTIKAPGSHDVTLIAGTDYVWTKDDQTFTTAPSDAGNYTVSLTDAGIAKIKAVNADNLDWANAKISGQGSYVITEATATANLSGKSSKTYDGQPVTTTEINSKDGTVEVTITIPNSTETVTYKLQDGDYTWNTPNGDAPTDAGSYTLSLSKTGLTHLQSAIDGKWGEGNVKISTDDLTGKATFTINKDDITISGDGSQTGTYTGNPQVVDPGNFPITLTPEGNGPVPTIPSGTLTSNDFTVKGKDGSPVDPTNVGDYTVYLTPEGVDKLKKLDPNYNWPTTEQEVGTLTITPAKMDVTLSGEGTKVSDGQPANVDLSTLVDNLTGAKLNKNGLTLDDFSWNTPDGNAPSKIGNYTITLNENGLKKLKDNNPNYTVSVTGEFKYTITAASQKIEYVDGNGNVIKTIDNIGTDSSNYGDKVDFDVKQNVPKDYELVDSTVSNQIIIENGVTKFVVKKIENDNPIEPPTSTPDNDHKTDKDDTNSDKPDLPKPDNKTAKPNKPSKPSKPSKPKKPSVPSEHKKTREDVSPKHNSRYQKNANEAGPVKAAVLNKLNKVNRAENIGVNTGLQNGSKQVDSIKNTRTLPQTGSRKENLSFVAGILAMGLGLFGLGSYRRKKK